jgi:hypothetical protein
MFRFAYIHVLLLTALFASGASLASAQDATAAAWRGLDVSGLQTIYVRDRAGAETEGKLLRLDVDSLVLLDHDVERRLAMDDVVRIQRRDGLKNGALIGAAVGVVMGLLAAGISDCPGDAGGSCAGARVATVGVSIGIYTGIGVGIDALVRGRTTIYTRPDANLSGLPGGVEGVAVRHAVRW